MKRIKRQRRPIFFEEMEPRLLFSADGLEELAAGAVEQSAVEETEPAAATQEEAETGEISVTAPVNKLEITVDVDEPGDSETDENAENENDIDNSPELIEAIDESPAEGGTVSETSVDANCEVEGENQERTEIVFVNDNVQEFDQLIEAMETEEDSNRSLQIVTLDSEESGIEQVTSALSEYTDVDAIHILSHGNDGYFSLGSDVLNNDDLINHSEEFSSWSAALTEDADILLYGCNIAADETGQQLTETLAALTGADVAASEDVTGAVTLGGDWELEFQVGDIETDIVVNSAGQSEYNAVLASATFQQNVNGYTSTYDTYINDSSTGTNYGNTTTIEVDSGATELVGLLRFDDLFGDGAGQIPYGSTINSVSLVINVLNGDALDEIAFYQVLTSWDESSTWASLGNGLSADDVEMGSTPLVTYDAGFVGELTFIGLEPIVQTWADGGDNYGFAFVSIAADNYQIASSEYADTSLRPQITIDYTPPVSPVITLSGSSVTYTENGADIAIDSALTLSDGDDTNLEGATVAITNYVNGEDYLAFTDQNGISGVFNATTGVLTLSGTATVADYQTALRSVEYGNSSNDPNTTTRTLSIEVSDEFLSSAAVTVDIDIIAVNDAPEGTDRTVDLVEDTDYIFTLADFGITDTEGDSLSAVLFTSLPTEGALKWNGSTFAANNYVVAQDIADGLLTYTPAVNYNGSTDSSFTFQVQDDGGTVSGGIDLDPTPNTFTFNVTAVNDAPVATADSFTVSEGSTATLNLAANDTDIDDSLDLTSITIVSGPANGTIDSINADGTVTYTHNGSETTADSFTYIIYDASGESSNEVTVNLTIDPQNDNPAIETTIPDQDLSEDFADYTIDLNGAFSDAETSDANFSYSVSGNANIGISITGGIATISSTLNWHGNETITFTATDEGGLTISQDVLFTVDPVDDAGSFGGDTGATISEDTSVAGTLTFSDTADGDTAPNFRIEAGDEPANGSATIDSATGVWSYAPTADWYGNDSFTVTVSDDDGNVQTQLITISVNAVNDAPVATTDSFTVSEGSTATLNLAANDTDIDDSLDLTSITIVSGPANGTIDSINADGTVTYTHNGSETTADSFTYIIYDASGESSNEVTVNLTIDPQNDNPAIETTIPDQDLSEDFADYTIDLNGAFSDAETSDANFSYSVSGNANIGVSITGGIATISSTLNWHGSEIITFTATDEGGLTISQDVLFTVDPVDDAGFFGGDTGATISEDTSVAGTLTFSDTADGDTAPNFRIEAGDEPANGSATIDSATGVWSYSPTAEWYGNDSFTVTVSDDDGNVQTQLITITVNAVNDAPVTTADSFTVSEGSTATLNLAANDTDIDDGLDLASITIISGPANGTINSINADGTVTYTHDGSETTADSFTYIIYDASGESSNEVTVNLTIDPQNDNPAIETTIPDQDLSEDFADYTIDLNGAFSDAETSDANFSYSVSGNINIGISITGGIATISSTLNWHGSETITFTATDEGGLTISQDVLFTVDPVDDAGFFGGDTGATISEDTSAAGTLTFSDTADGDTAPNFRIEAGDEPANGSATIDSATGVWSYAPTADWYGNDSFTVTVSDDDGNVQTQLITISVNAVNDAPMATTDSFTVSEGSTATLNLAANDTDIDDGLDLSSITIISGPANGTIDSINGDGTVTYTHDGSETTADSFTYIIYDASGESSNEVTVNLTIDPQNDNPAIETTIPDQDLSEDFADYTIDLNGAFSDAETSDANFSYSVSGNANIGVSITGGIATISSTLNWHGSETITFTATDEGGLTISQDVLFTVDPVDDAGSFGGDTGATISEDTSVAGTLTFTDTADGDTAPSFRIEAGDEPANGSAAIDSATGVWSYAPTADWYGNDSFTVTVSDDDGNVQTQLITISVNAVNDAPMATTDSFTVSEGSTATLNLAANDTDIDDGLDLASITIISGPANGTIDSINGDGTVTYTHDGSETTADSFTYIIYDASGESSNEVTVNLTIDPQNDNPAVEATIPDQDLSEDFADYTIDLNGAFSDAETSDANFSYSVSGNANIGVSITGGIATISSTLNWHGSETITFTATDEGGLTISQDVLFTVDPVDDTGAFGGDTGVTISEDTSAAGTLTFSDTADGDTAPNFRIEAGDGPANGSATIDSATGVWSYAPTADWYGDDSFTVTVSDDDGNVQTQLITITVNAVNDAPTFLGSTLVTNGTFDTSSDNWYNSGTVAWTAGIMRFSETASFISQTIDTVAGETYIVKFDYFDSSESQGQSLRVDVKGSTTLLSEEVTSSVANTTRTSYAFTFIADSTSTTIQFTDTSATHSGVRGYLDSVIVAQTIATGAVNSYTEGDGAITPWADLVIADIDNTTLNSVSVTISGNFSGAEDTLNFTDQNGITGVWDNATGILTLSGTAKLNLYQDAIRSITYENSSENPSTLDRTLSLVLNDGNSNSDAVTSTISITAINDAPTTSTVDLGAISEDGSIIINQANLLTNANDIDGDALTALNLAIASGNGTLTDNGDGTWTFNPDTDWNGPVSFSYDISDATTTIAADASLTVNPVNDAPTTATVDLGSINEDGSLTINQADLLANANDIDGDTLTALNLAISSGSGTLTDNGDGTWTFNPDADWNGTVSFSYDISDATATITADASLTVNPVNDAPTTATVDLGSINEDGSLTINQAELLANANDIDGDALTALNLAIASGSGTLTDNGDGTWTFNPDADWNGTVSFSYDISDATATITADASLTVNPVNDAPTTATVDLGSINEDGSLTINQAELLANANDIDSDSLTALNLAISSGSGTLADNGDGTWTFNPDADWNGTVSFSYDISDATATITADASLTVNPVNDAPTAATVDLGSINEDGSLTINQAELLANANDIDGDALTALNLAIASGSGTLTDNGDGTWTFNPDANWNGPVSFSYNISDATTTIAANASLTVNPVNDAPTTSTVDLNTINEDGSITINQADLLINAADVDGDALTALNLSISSGNGTLTDNGDGTWSFDPDADWNGPVSFSYNISDATTTIAADASLTVNPVNDAPTTATVDLGAISEDGAITITQADLLANANDIDGDALTALNLAITSGNGTLTDNGDGTWTFNPDADWNGTVSFSYDISDATATITADASLTVNPVNDAPTTATVDLGSINEDGSLTINQAELLANANDIDGDALTVLNLAISSGSGTLTDNGDGTWTFNPDADWNGPVSFSYIISDATTTIAADASLTVTPVNDAPTTSTVDFGSINEDGSITINQADLLANATDIDGDVLTALNLAISSGNGTLTDNGDGAWTFNPNADWNGPVSFSYIISDATTTIAADASLTVNPVNDSPTTSTVDLNTINEDGSITINQTDLLINAADVDGDALTALNLAISSGNGTLTDNGDGTWSFDPDADWNGPVSFSYDISDATTTIAADASLTVNPVNDAPTTATVDLGAISEDGSITINQAHLLTNANDIDGDALTALNLAISSGNGTLTDNCDGTWTFNPDADWNGPVSFSYDISDATTNIAADASLTVNPVNDAPTTSTVDLGSINEDGSITINQADLLMGANDTDGDTLSAMNLTLSSGNGALIDNFDGTWLFLPAENWNGSVSLDYVISDGTTATPNTATFVVNAVNDAPTAAPDSLTLAEGGSQTIDLSANDTDIDGSLDLGSIVIIASPTNGSVVVNDDGTVSYTHNGSETTTDSFTYTIYDQNGAVSNTTVVDITITPQNDAPITSGIDLGAIDEDNSRLITQADLLMGATDPEATPLTAINLTLTGGQGVLLDNLDGTWLFLPEANWHGPVAFEYEITDGTATITNTGNFIVTSVNDIPVAANDSLSTTQESAITGNLLQNDSDMDGDILLPTIVENVSHGTLLLNPDGSFTYTPSPGFSGTDNFTYTVNDGTTDSTTATVMLTVTPVDPGTVDVSDDVEDDVTDPVTAPETAPLIVPSDHEPHTELPENQITTDDTDVKITVDSIDFGEQRDESPSESREPLRNMQQTPNTAPIIISGTDSLAPEETDETDDPAAAQAIAGQLPYLQAIYTEQSHDNTRPVVRDSYADILLAELQETTESPMTFIRAYNPDINHFAHAQDISEVQLTEGKIHARLDAIYNDMDLAFAQSQEEHKLMAFVSGGILASFSAGAVSYVLRAGSLMSSLLATMPVWKSFDPIAVLVDSRQSRLKRKREKIQESLQATAQTDSKDAERLFTRKNNE